MTLISIHFFIIIIKHSNNNYKNRIKKEITQLRINFPKKVLQFTITVKNNLNQLCQANKRYKFKEKSEFPKNNLQGYQQSRSLWKSDLETS